MTDSAFTRREFLQSGLTLASMAATVPAFVQQSALAMDHPGAATASRPGVPEERVLVIVQLSGGNDGLNTVVPFGDDAYYKARPALAIPKKDVLPLGRGAGIGLHPELTDLKEMVDQGLVGIMLGVGYPNPNRSHFASMDIWHSADPAGGGKELGWIGRALDEVAGRRGSGPEATACVCLGHEPPLAAQGKLTKPVTFERANLFRWAGDQVQPELAGAYHQLNQGALARELGGTDDTQLGFVLRTAMDAQIASDRVRRALDQSPRTTFPGNPLGQQLRTVAAMIRAQLPTRVYYVGLGGFDTHAGQPGRHGGLLRQFGASMRAFYQELAATGQAGRVLTLAFSEFGRRVAENASQGTDHGTAGPLFAPGPMVQPGVSGTYPSLTRLDNGDLIHSTDFRSVYASVLERWMKVDSKKVLGQAFAPAPVLQAKVG